MANEEYKASKQDFTELLTAYVGIFAGNSHSELPRSLSIKRVEATVWSISK